MKKPKKTVEQLANQQVVAMLLSTACEASHNTGNGQIVQVVQSLNELEELTSQHVQEAIGFVDGCLELTKKMAAICRRRRELATENTPYDSPDEVPSNVEMAFTGTPEQTYMIRTRAFLAAVWNHLEGKQPPSPLKELISTPNVDQPPQRDHGPNYTSGR